MSLSPLPLSYCTNVHPGRTVAEVDEGLDRYTAEVRRRLGRLLAAGLWLAAPVVRELLATEGAVSRFAERLAARDLVCHTLNAFPYGDFHSPRVKENVYRPDWSQPERLDYTSGCAAILARLLPEGTEGSISTVPLGFKGFEQPADFVERACDRLVELARRLDRLHAKTGRMIRLAIEPEPFCLLETTAETIAFFERLWTRTGGSAELDILRRHIGVCYDVCHQAVEFEHAGRSVGDIERAGIRINKVHITCALELDRPAENREGREALARYVEPRYLHQTFARTPDGRLLRSVDLNERLARDPPPEFLDAETWRIHFHVPVDAERLGPLATTRPELEWALSAVDELDYAPHLEVETYTWEVLPGEGPIDLVEGLTRELRATERLLGEIGS